MKKCKFCGRENQDNSNFCEFCGNRLAPNAENIMGKPVMADKNNPVGKQTGKMMHGEDSSDFRLQRLEDIPVVSDNGYGYYANSTRANLKQQIPHPGYKRRSNKKLLIIIPIVLFVIAALVAAAVIVVTSRGKEYSRDFAISKSIDILTEEVTITVGQTVELQINSTVPHLDTNYNECVDTYWNNNKTSNGKYYLEVTGVEAGTCHLEVYDRDDAGLYDIVTIYVISSDDGAVGTEAETEADTVPPVGAKRTLEVPAIKDNTVTVDGIFVGETQIITEEDTIMFTGNLSSDGAEDVYSYTAPRDGRYGFKVLNINANESVRLTVFDSSGSSLLDTWNGIGYVAMSSGKTYKIRVRQYSGYPKYTLNLYVQKPTVDISATTTVYDQVTFEDQKNDYTFTAPVTGRYHFELSEYKSGVGFRMMMWDKFANNFMDSWTESATVDLDAGETYNFQIRQEEGFGSYVLSVGFQKETVDITGVTAVYDSIEYTDQKNVYTFTAPVTGRYHFELSEYKNGVGFRMMMWDKLEYNIMDSWNGSATVDLDAGEAYSLQIRQDKSAYSYKLSIGSQKKYVDITGYDIVTDAITFKDQKNVYFFTPSEAGEYTFSLTDYNANCSFKLMAWDDYEKNIMDTYSGKGTLSLEGGITYEIQVRQNENLGSYELHVEKEK